MTIVYVIQHNETRERYIGHTANLKRRLWQHNHNLSKATRRPSGRWILVYAEAYRDNREAIEREQRLKNHGRAKQELYQRIKKSLLP